MLTISLIVFTDKLQGHVHTFYEKRVQYGRKREGSTKGKGGLYKKLQIPTLPPSGQG